MPTYYFPQKDVRMDALASSAQASPDGEVAYKTIRIGDRVAEPGAWIVLGSPSDLVALQGYVSFAWGKSVAPPPTSWCGAARRWPFLGAMSRRWQRRMER